MDREDFRSEIIDLINNASNELDCNEFDLLIEEIENTILRYKG